MPCWQSIFNLHRRPRLHHNMVLTCIIPGWSLTLFPGHGVPSCIVQPSSGTFCAKATNALILTLNSSYSLCVNTIVFLFGIHGVMGLAASIFWIRKMWMWWIHSTRKRVLHWRILSLLRCTWLIVISLFISFFNLYHTLIYAPYATALFSNLYFFGCCL